MRRGPVCDQAADEKIDDLTASGAASGVRDDKQNGLTRFDYLLERFRIYGTVELVADLGVGQRWLVTSRPKISKRFLS